MSGSQEKWLLALFILFCVGVVAVALAWKANPFYTHAYRPMVEKSIRNRQADEEESKEPRPAGFREREIRKRQGNRYATY